MTAPIRARLVEIDFSLDEEEILVTLRVRDCIQTFRAGNYLLIEADDEFRPVESD